ncbi:MAG: ABC transporter ATP-binding protein [Tepidiformaceae bacterium]
MLQNVVKEYPGPPPVRALAGVSLDVQQGELLGIVGASGSGKSTLLHVMGTLARPTSGSIFIDGLDTAGMSENELAGIRSKKIGFIFQEFFLLPGVSAVENVANGLLYSGIQKTERIERSLNALQKVGLSHRSNHHPNEMSGGEQQRVAVARALVNEPTFILADEPTGNLDSKSTEALMKLFVELNQSGTTIVLITHDLEVAHSLPRRITIKDGLVETDSQLSQEITHE